MLLTYKLVYACILLSGILLQGLCVPSVKTTTYVRNSFNPCFCTRGHRTHQAISNLNFETN